MCSMDWSRFDGTVPTNISELIKLKNYKQAAKNVDKALKKKQNDLDLQILHAWLLFASDDCAKAGTLLNNLALRQPPISERDHLSKLYILAVKLRPHDGLVQIEKIEKLWFGAIKSKPQASVTTGEALSMLAIELKQWETFRKVAFELEQRSQAGTIAKKKYFFWRISAMYLTDKTQRKLAKLFTQKAVNGDKILPSLSDAQDLAVLEKLFTTSPDERNNGAGDSKAQLLANLETLSKQSEFSSDLMSIIIHEKMMANLRRPVNDASWNLICSAIENICHDKKKASLCYADQWQYLWAPLLWDWPTDADEVQKETRFKAIDELIGKSLSLNPQLKSPQYVRILANSYNAHIPSSELVESYRNFFTEHSAEVMCAKDIASLVIKFDQTAFTELHYQIRNISSQNYPRDHSEQLRWINKELSVLNIDYLRFQRYLSSPPLKDSSTSAFNPADGTALLIAVILRFLRTGRQHTITIDNRDIDPIDEAAILVAKAFSLLSDHLQTRKLQLACLLMYLCEQSKSNMYLQHLLYRNLKALGASSLALESFNSMRIRSILIEDNHCLMFNRISACHPPSDSWGDPLAKIDKALDWYSSTLRNLYRYNQLAFREGKHDQALELIEFNDQLSKSYTRNLLSAEKQRMALLSGTFRHAHGLSLEDMVFAPYDKKRAKRKLDDLTEDRNSNSYLSYLILSNEAIELVLDNAQPLGESLEKQLEEMMAKTEISSNGQEIEESALTWTELLIHRTTKITNLICRELSRPKIIFSSLENALAKLKALSMSSDSLDECALMKDQIQTTCLPSLNEYEETANLNILFRIVDAVLKRGSTALKSKKTADLSKAEIETLNALMATMLTQNAQASASYREALDSRLGSVKECLSHGEAMPMIFGTDGVDGEDVVTKAVLEVMGTENASRLSKRLLQRTEDSLHAFTKLFWVQ